LRYSRIFVGLGASRVFGGFGRGNDALADPAPVALAEGAVFTTGGGGDDDDDVPPFLSGQPVSSDAAERNRKTWERDIAGQMTKLFIARQALGTQ